MGRTRRRSTARLSETNSKQNAQITAIVTIPDPLQIWFVRHEAGSDNQQKYPRNIKAAAILKNAATEIISQNKSLNYLTV